MAHTVANRLFAIALVSFGTAGRVFLQTTSEEIQGGPVIVIRVEDGKLSGRLRNFKF